MAAVSKEEQRREKAKALRYKRPALATMGYHEIYSELNYIRGGKNCEH